MKLITNNHADTINELILTAKKVTLCSGWLNAPGINKILDNLGKASNENIEVSIYSNSGHTTQSAKTAISKYQRIKHVVVNKKNKYLHSKIYYFEQQEIYSAIIGSANLTKGGLGKNEEISVLVVGKIGSSEHVDIVKYLNKIEKLKK